MLGNDDYLQRAKGRLLTWAPHVMADMNLNALKTARRELMSINKRTNTIDLPCNASRLSSVNIMDEHGVLYPVYRNERLHDDIVDIGAVKDCNCEHNCGYKLCNTIKGYESIVTTMTDKNPDGSTATFQCVTRKGVDSNGYFYEQKQYPLRRYVSGVWTDTVLHTENIKLCKVQVDDNGCVCDNDSNVDALCHSCGIQNNDNLLCCVGGTASKSPNDNCDTWIYYCDSKMDWFSMQCGGFAFMPKPYSNIYNVTELGNRLIFPPDFGWDKVMVRWYEDTDIDNIRVPAIALDTFILGLKWWDSRFNDKKLALASVFGPQYARSKFGLVVELNKRRIAAFRMMLSPPAFIPSYINNRR